MGEIAKIVLSGFGGAVIGSWITHCLTVRKERKAEKQELINNLNLAKIDLSYGSSMDSSTPLPYMVGGIDTLLASRGLHLLKEETVEKLAQLRTVFLQYNISVEPHANLPGNSTKANAEKALTYKTANKLFKLEVKDFGGLSEGLQKTICGIQKEVEDARKGLTPL